ncbi:uncharacterized protein LOC127848327 isoform X2 [Dreissena polymorpha]|nr:uncharacterized protein LOC127848327 isoform X2 [Dreissena polymorpha]
MEEEREMSDVSTLPQFLYNQAVEGHECCDVTLQFGNTAMRAHWYVLVRCPFFEAMYKVKASERQTGIIQITEGTEDAITAAIEFLYTNQTRLELPNIEDVLHVANYLQIDDLVHLCGQFLRTSQLTPENCLPIYLIVKRCHFDLHENLLLYIKTHLQDIADSTQLCDISSDEMTDILANLDLCDIRQDAIIYFLSKWMSYDEEIRQLTFVKIFCELKLNLTDDDVCSFSSKYNFLQCSELCRKYMFRCIVVPSLFVFSEETVDVHSRYIWMLNVSCKQWTQLTALPVKLNNSFTTELFYALAQDSSKHFLYALKDQYNREAADSTFILIQTFKYDILLRTWTVENFKYEETDSSRGRVDIKSLVCVKNKLFLTVTPLTAWSQPKSLRCIVFQSNKEMCVQNYSLMTWRQSEEKLLDVKACTVGCRYVVVLWTTELVSYFRVLDVCKEEILTRVLQHDVIGKQLVMVETHNGVIVASKEKGICLQLNGDIQDTLIVESHPLPRSLIFGDESVELDDTALYHGCGFNAVAVYSSTSNKLFTYDFETRTVSYVSHLPFKIGSGSIFQRTALSAAFLD